MRVTGVIPARYESRRFPGKPLAEIYGKSLIQRVYEQALQCKDLTDLVVATDDRRIFDHVNGFGKAVMTRPDHRCGTDRCLEAFELLNGNKAYSDNDLMINIQGDQPFIHPEQITAVIHSLKNKKAEIITLVTRIKQKESKLKSDVVKVVCDNNHKALYFSRAPIPFIGNETYCKSSNLYALKHIGIYGFRIKTLKRLCSLPLGKLEQAEGLEQLRWLEFGFEIRAEESVFDSISIDRRGDILHLRETI